MPMKGVIDGIKDVVQAAIDDIDTAFGQLAIGTVEKLVKDVKVTITVNQTVAPEEKRIEGDEWPFNLDQSDVRVQRFLRLYKASADCVFFARYFPEPLSKVASEAHLRVQLLLKELEKSKEAAP